MANNKDIILDIKGLKKFYPIYKGILRRVVGYIKAVDNVDLFIRKGETLGLVGESGCGKTTLGQCIVRMHAPSSGEIRYNLGNNKMIDLLTLDKQEGFNVKRKIQMIFQDPYSSFNPVKTIYNSFDEPMRTHQIANKNERKDIIEKLLKIVNLLPEYMYHYPHEFSGGQRQRICIARALCLNPELIICDEPVSALDVSIQAQVLNLLKDLQKKMDLSYLFIAHDLSVVEYMSDRIAIMYLGKIVELLTSNSIRNSSKHPYTIALLSAIPIPELDKKRYRIVLKGDIPSAANPPLGCRFHTRCWKSQEICKHEEPKLELVKGTIDHYAACHFVDTKNRRDKSIFKRYDRKT